MDGLTVEEQIEREVREAMREHSISREEASLLVALRRGYVYGAGDLVSLTPLSPEQRRLLGLDHDPEQLIAESRARLGLPPSPQIGAAEDELDALTASTVVGGTDAERE